jgi:hypothetical protein
MGKPTPKKPESNGVMLHVEFHATEGHHNQFIVLDGINDGLEISVEFAGTHKRNVVGVLKWSQVKEILRKSQGRKSTAS